MLTVGSASKVMCFNPLLGSHLDFFSPADNPVMSGPPIRAALGRLQGHLY